MRWSRVITVVGAHAEGEVGRVVTGGVLDVPGATMMDKLRALEAGDDRLRRFLLHEPRGSAQVSANLLLPPTRPEADAGFICMQSTDYQAMSGSNAMCVVTVLLETGMVPMREPETRVVLDTPAGLVMAHATCQDGKCLRVSLELVPSFVGHLDHTLEVEGLGTLAVDVAYGGAWFALVDAAALGFAIRPDEARGMVETGIRIKRAAAEQVRVRHPELPGLDRVNFVMYCGGAGETLRGATVMDPGRLDRSPCGTGTAARLAALHARGRIGVGRRIVQESTIGSRFEAEIVRTAEVGGRPAVVPRITGRAWIFALHQFGVDPSDPYPEGYTLTDTWGPGVRAAGVD